MEHTGRLQIHHHRQGPYGVGIMRPFQPKPFECGHCERWVGQAGQGTTRALSVVLPRHKMLAFFVFATSELRP